MYCYNFPPITPKNFYKNSDFPILFFMEMAGMYGRAALLKMTSFIGLFKV